MAELKIRLFFSSAIIFVLRITTSYLQHLLTAAEAGRCRSEQGWFLHSWKKMRMLPGCLTLKSLYSVQWPGHDLAYLPNSERWAPLPHCEPGTFLSTELSKTERRRIPAKFLQKINVGGYSSNDSLNSSTFFIKLFNNPHKN